jgi:hypothetical protein
MPRIGATSQTGLAVCSAAPSLTHGTTNAPRPSSGPAPSHLALFVMVPPTALLLQGTGRKEVLSNGDLGPWKRQGRGIIQLSMGPGRDSMSS